MGPDKLSSCSEGLRGARGASPTPMPPLPPPTQPALQGLGFCLPAPTPLPAPSLLPQGLPKGGVPPPCGLSEAPRALVT